MAAIRRYYWNRNIKEVTSIPTDASWIKTRIEGHDYYGRSLKGKHLEKCKIVVGKIIPLFALSIALAPISIPILFAMGKYRELGVSIREIHYNTKIECILNLSKANLNKPKAPTQDSPNPGIDNSFPLNHPHADEMLIPKMFVDPSIADSKEALEYLRLLSCVSKSFASSTVDQTTKALINSRKLLLKDIPGIKTKDDAFNYIQGWDDLSHLDLSGLRNVTDADISSIVNKWPNLETLIVDDAFSLSENSINEIVRLSHLKKLHLHCLKKMDSSLLNQLTDLEELSLEGLFDTIPFINLPKLKKLNIMGNGLSSPLNHLTQLKELSFVTDLSDLSDISLLKDLEKLKIYNTRPTGSLDSLNIFFDQLTKLKEVTISGLYSELPDISMLSKLENLTIEDPALTSIPVDYFDPLINLNKLSLSSDLIDFPSLDNLPNLKELTLQLSINSKPPSLNSLILLEKLTIAGYGLMDTSLKSFPSNYFDALVSLKILDIRFKRSELDLPGIDKLTSLEELIVQNPNWNMPSALKFPHPKKVTINKIKLN